MFSPKTILVNRKQSIQNQFKLIKIIETYSDQDNSSQMKIISFTDRAAIDYAHNAGSVFINNNKC